MTRPDEDNPFIGIGKILRIRRYILQMLAGPLGLAFIVFGVPTLGPAWTAHTGGGTPGTFTVVRQECDDRDCTWRGDFQPTGGGPIRYDITMAGGGPKISGVGNVLPAVDTGSPYVYPQGGGDAWLLWTLLVAAGPALIVVWYFTGIRPIWRWWSGRRHEQAMFKAEIAARPPLPSRTQVGTMPSGTSILGGPVFREDR